MSKKNYKKFNGYENKSNDNRDEIKNPAEEEVLELAKDLSDKETVKELDSNEKQTEELNKIETVTKEPVIKKVKSDCRLNLRTEDSKDSDVILVLKPDTEILELEKSGDWSYVRYEEGGLTITGFVMNKFLY